MSNPPHKPPALHRVADPEEPTSPGTPNVLVQVRDLVERGNRVFADVSNVLDQVKKAMADVANELHAMRIENTRKDEQVERRLSKLERRLSDVEEAVAALQSKGG